MMKTLLCSAMGLACLLAFTVQAQVQRSGNADARVAQQLQQLTSERAALQAENAKLKQELEQAKAEAKKASVAAKASENRSRALEVSAGRGTKESQQATEQLERSRAQLQELVAKFRETTQSLSEVETDRGAIRTRLAAAERELKTCVDSNAALYNLNTEVLDRVQNRGFWTSVAEREPFTKLKRVQLENMSDDYRYRADELRLQKQQQAQQ